MRKRLILTATAVALFTGCVSPAKLGYPAPSSVLRSFPKASYARGGCDFSVRMNNCIAYVREPEAGEPWTVHGSQHCTRIWLAYADGQRRVLHLTRRDSPVVLDIAERPERIECGQFDILPEAH